MIQFRASMPNNKFTSIFMTQSQKLSNMNEFFNEIMKSGSMLGSSEVLDFFEIVTRDRIVARGGSRSRDASVHASKAEYFNWSCPRAEYSRVSSASSKSRQTDSRMKACYFHGRRSHETTYDNDGCRYIQCTPVAIAPFLCSRIWCDDDGALVLLNLFIVVVRVYYLYYCNNEFFPKKYHERTLNNNFSSINVKRRPCVSFVAIFEREILRERVEIFIMSKEAYKEAKKHGLRINPTMN